MFYSREVMENIHCRYIVGVFVNKNYQTVGKVWNFKQLLNILIIGNDYVYKNGTRTYVYTKIGQEQMHLFFLF